MNLSLAQSYAWCERLARREGRNFYPAFRLLPRPQRQAMCALYAFYRLTDDLADGPGVNGEKLRAVTNWRNSLHDSLSGTYHHPVQPALHDTIERYQVPTGYLEAVIEGVTTDLTPVSFETFTELYQYCYRVASAVGLACIHIWGFHGDEAKKYAEDAGIAFQLTNILRDIPEDLDRGRVYLPREDLERFGCCSERLRRRPDDPAFREMMQFQLARARGYYESARRLSGCLDPVGRAVFHVMIRTYSGILDQIERRDYDVFAGRVRVGRWRKLRFTLEALPVRWGWVGA